jgi:hypothetical protein
MLLRGAIGLQAVGLSGFQETGVAQAQESPELQKPESPIARQLPKHGPSILALPLIVSHYTPYNTY